MGFVKKPIGIRGGPLYTRHTCGHGGVDGRAAELAPGHRDDADDVRRAGRQVRELDRAARQRVRVRRGPELLHNTKCGWVMSSSKGHR